VPQQKQVALFQALADPTRLAIFEHLSHGESTVTGLVQRFPVSQPAISQHLAALRRCHLVSHRREGRKALYRARAEGLAPLADWLNHYRIFWPERLARLKTMLEGQSAAEGEKS
jgi:DNA-binding transcriptional ArsR family regulator